MATPNKGPKAMSSRLSEMKFMKRSNSTPDQPPGKKQRLSEGSFNASPYTPQDREDSRWYLSFQTPQKSADNGGMRIATAGFSALDSNGSKAHEEIDEEEEQRPQVSGRRSFGKFNKAIEKQQNPDMSSSDSESEEEADEDEDPDADLSDDPTGAKAMIQQTRKEAAEKARQERSAKRKAAKAESLKMAGERRNKQVKLNGLTSISGGGSGTPPSAKNITCHKCGEKGHFQKDCKTPRKDQKASR